MSRSSPDGETEVHFVDFDWSGESGVIRYPCFMNHRSVPWPEGARDYKVAFQEHDIALLSSHLPSSHKRPKSRKKPPSTVRKPARACMSRPFKAAIVPRSILCVHSLCCV